MNTLSNNNDTHCGIVSKKTIGSYSVATGEKQFTCSLSSRLRKQFRVDPVAIGDRVQFIVSEKETGQIVDILPRNNWLARRSAVPMPGAYAHEQIIAANVDQVIPVFAAANPRPAWHLLDRYLVSAESAGIPSLVCITKLDLAGPGSHAEEIETVAQEYRAIGYSVILTSTITGEGLDEFKRALQGRLSVFVGKSGVGKTSLLNAIQPGLGMRVQETNQISGKGRHTTTHLQMFELDFGGAIIDTPGIREFGLWDIDQDDMAMFFPEMRPFVGKCKFGLDCLHDEEPGCAIRKAVTAGQISPYRYKSYLKLIEEP